VLLRIEDHDRQRCRPEYDAAVLEDLDWLGFVPDVGPVRQTDPDTVSAFEAALAGLRARGVVYGDCARSTFTAWARSAGRPWSGPGCPGSCRSRGLGDAAPTLRVALGDGAESWNDALLGPSEGPIAPAGDLVVRDRHGNWTYGFCVVVDDLRHGIGLVVRGRDLLPATPAQIRLGRHVGRDAPPAFLHHPLIRRPDGSKLSKSSADTGVRELRAAGHDPVEVFALVAARG